MNKLLSVIMSIAVAAALLTGSIAAPICLRSFYYAHIGPLGLEEKSWLSENEIRQAYDEVLDYCTGKSDEFSAGVLPFSADGAAHFADCRELFILDFRVFAVSAVLIVALTMYRRKRGLHRFLGRGPAFWEQRALAEHCALSELWRQRILTVRSRCSTAFSSPARITGYSIREPIPS